MKSRRLGQIHANRPAAQQANPGPRRQIQGEAAALGSSMLFPCDLANCRPGNPHRPSAQPHAPSQISAQLKAYPMLISLHKRSRRRLPSRPAWPGFVFQAHEDSTTHRRAPSAPALVGTDTRPYIHAALRRCYAANATAAFSPGAPQNVLIHEKPSHAEMARDESTPKERRTDVREAKIQP